MSFEPSETRYVSTYKQQQASLAQKERSTAIQNFGKYKGSAGVAGTGKNWKRPDRLYKPFIFNYYNEINHDDYWLTLFINPEELSQSDSERLTVTQTKGGAFVDHFGRGLSTITIRGVTGFATRQVGNFKVTGQQHFLDLKSMFIGFWNWSEKYPGKVHLYFLNVADQESWEVVAPAVTLLRSSGRPLLYQYNIQMTCIKRIGDKGKTIVYSWETWEEMVRRPSGRPPLVYNRLNTELGWVGSILNKYIDVTKFSAATQQWANWINKGKEFYDTVNEVYKTIDNVISEVEQFSKDIGMFVEGATSFITKPFELVKDLALSLGDAIHEMCSVAEIPHELVRSFREMQCAIKSLPEQAFKGFTNPYLFEGESNCGASLGIAEAPVAAYNNSFTATAQIAPERIVSQIFTTPQLILTLKEDPLSVIGAYLETDTARSGGNYLESWTGKSVSLTSVPGQAVVVDYKIIQTTATKRITLEATRARVIQDGDTIERISGAEYKGDPTKWKEIVLYNNLEYPFIVSSDFDTTISATGIVRFYRIPGSAGVITILVATACWVPIYQGTDQIDFMVTTTTILPLAQQYVDVPVRAVLDGSIGNVAPNRITGFTPIPGILRISNISGTTGGKIWRVMLPGDIIQIPSSEVTPVSSTIAGTAQSYKELFGVDIVLNGDGEIGAGTEGEPDLGKISAVDNLVQALKNRLATSKGFYVYHPEYGSNLPYYIGKKNIPYWEEVATMDVKDVCLLDPRISSIKEFAMIVEGDTVGIDFDAVPINENTALPISLIV